MGRKSGSILYDLATLPWWASVLGLIVTSGLYGFWLARSADAQVGIFKPLISATTMFIQIAMLLCAVGLVLSVGREIFQAIGRKRAQESRANDSGQGN